MTTHPTIGTVAMGDTEADMRLAAASIRKWMPSALPEDADGKKHFARVLAEAAADAIEQYQAALSTRPAQEPVATEERMSAVYDARVEQEATCTAAAMSQWERSQKRPDLQEKDRVRGAIEAYKRQAFAFAVLPAAPQPVLSQPEVKAEARELHNYCRILLANLDFLSEVTGESIGEEDAVIVNEIRSALCPLSDIPAKAGEVEPYGLRLQTIAAEIQALKLHPATGQEYDAGYIAARNDAFAIVHERMMQMANDPQMQHEANIFAMELLMPFDFVVADMQGIDLADDLEIEKLANRYRVPRGVMAMRIADVRTALATASEGE